MVQIRAEKSVRVSDLALQYDVTEETIRRDLDKLDKDGKIKKTYGGAVLEEKVSRDPSFMDRQKVNMAGKRQIGERASKLIEDGETLFIDMSTTALEVVKAVPENKKITVITNAVEALIVLSKKKHIKVITIGGTLDRSNLFMGGPMATRFIEHYYVDKAFFSVKGLTKERDFMDTSEDIAQLKALMVKNAKEAILVADSGKFGQSALVSVIQPEDIAKVVTDQPLDEGWQDYFTAKGIEIIG